MEWSLWIIGYVAVGIILTLILWKKLSIQWDMEAGDTKALIIVTPVLWPLVLLFLLFIKVFTK